MAKRKAWVKIDLESSISWIFEYDHLHLCLIYRGIFYCFHHWTHWSWVTHVCVANLNIIFSCDGLSLSRRQAIIRTNAGIVIIVTLGTNCSEILIKFKYLFEIFFENIVFETLSISYWPQRVKNTFVWHNNYWFMFLLLTNHFPSVLTMWYSREVVRMVFAI